MKLFTKVDKGVSLLVVVFLGLVLSSVEAKAGFFDSNEEDDQWFNSEEKETKGKPIDTPVVPPAAHENHGGSGDKLALGGVISSNQGGNQPKEGLQGGRYSGYNESCGPNRPSCIPDSKLACSSTDGTGKCECIDGYVYVRETESCWVVPKSSQDPCAHDVQCHEGKWGHLSRCSKHSGSCECYDYRSSGKLEMVKIKGVCYVKKTQGDLCNNNEECDKPMDGGFCRSGSYEGAGGYYNGSCDCLDSHIWHKLTSKCYPKATELDFPCTVTSQCMMGSLGNYSICDSNSGKCICKDIGNLENPRDVVYYKEMKKCFIKKEYNDTCVEAEQCKASLGPDVVCAPHWDGTSDENVCHCPQGKTCRSGGFSNVLQTGSTIYTVGAAILMLMMGSRRG